MDTRQAKGVAKGEAKMLLYLLESRGIELTEPQREMVDTCTDTDQLKTWFERGLKADTAADVFG